MNCQGNYYTKEHEWVTIINENAFIGLTDLAIKELKSIKSIKVHTLNQTLNKDQVFARVKTSQYLCKLIMPFKGTIIGINTEYINSINENRILYSPKCWLVNIKPSYPMDKSNLLSESEYKSHKMDNIFHMVKYLIPIKNEEK
jgi:glycine cleavage system H lipoate-binding protein